MLGLVDCSEPSVTDSDQGCVAGMQLAEAKLKGIGELGYMLMNMSLKSFYQNREERCRSKVIRVGEIFGFR